MGISAFDKEVRQYVGLSIPAEAESNYEIQAILNVFYLACRGRKYVGGMSIVPLPLSVRDISDVVEAHITHIARERLDPCVFALDDEWLNTKE